jgi:predicted thioesterase
MEGNQKLELGIQHQEREKVSIDKSAAKVGSGLLEVYSTPAMIALMEKTAYLSIQPYLNEGEGSVGAEVNIRHVRPTPIGREVRCLSEVTAIEGRRIEFHVEAFDEKGKIGEGFHARYIIDNQMFMQKAKN